jgi:hypothetical protein
LIIVHGCHFSLYAKKSNQKKRSAGREPMLRIGALRSSANQGPVRKASRLAVGSTGHRHLFVPDSPAVLDSLKADSKSRANASTHGVDLLDAAVAFDLGPP